MCGSRAGPGTGSSYGLVSDDGGGESGNKISKGKALQAERSQMPAPITPPEGRPGNLVKNGSGFAHTGHRAFPSRVTMVGSMRRRNSTGRPVAAACATLLAAGLLAACTTAGTSTSAASASAQASSSPSGTVIAATGIHKIKHVIVVMQENRSFDSYFGTYPGVDGIPMSNGTPTVCVPNPAGGCTRPYHDTADVNGGGPHGEANAVADVDSGKMDGFIAQRDKAKKSCSNPND